MKVYILGSVGIPARYGGFEVFAENISAYLSKEFEVFIACSKPLYSASERSANSNNPKCFYIPCKANGIQSIWYDFISLLIAYINSDFVIMLGSGSGLSIAIFKVFNRQPIAVHIDGLEWKRKKWSYFSRLFLKFNAFLCYQFAEYLIIDNTSLIELIPSRFARKVIHVSYGCDHLPVIDHIKSAQQRSFALAIARAEPENNLQMIIEAFLSIDNLDLVIISNWTDTAYGRQLLKKYTGYSQLKLIGPIYNDQNTLQKYRLSCKVYIHGHCAGGTNPSLVEAMASGIPILAHDNIFNRTTTDKLAFYFKDRDEILSHISNLDTPNYRQSGIQLKELAHRKYSWSLVSDKLIELIRRGNVNNT